MSRSWILFLPLVAVATSASAQLTPEQRQVQEAKAFNAEYSRHLSEHLERRALDGDPSAYGGPAAQQERRRVWERDAWLRWQVEASATPLTGSHWIAVGPGPVELDHLRRPGPATLNTKAGTTTLLTLASPFGGPARPLMIRTAAGSETAPSSWTRMAEVTADEAGRYFVVIPALTPGRYDLQIEVYDPDRPVAPVSTSRSTLVVR